MKNYKVASIKKENINKKGIDISSMYPLKIKASSLYGFIGNKKSSIFNPSN